MDCNGGIAGKELQDQVLAAKSKRGSPIKSTGVCWTGTQESGSGRNRHIVYGFGTAKVSLGRTGVTIDVVTPAVHRHGLPRHSERRKLRMSCCCAGSSASNRLIT